MIEFGTDNVECGKFPPYVISCNEIIGENEPLNTLVIEVGVESGSTYKIIFEKSRMLDMLDTLIIHTDDHSWPGIGKHFGVYTCDHIIDIISVYDPIIQKIN